MPFDKLTMPLTAQLKSMRAKLLNLGAGMIVLFLFLYLIDGCRHCSQETSWWVAFLSLCSLVVLCGKTTISLARQDPNLIWTPALIFPFATLVYFGFGASSVLFSSQQTQSFLMSGNYAIDPHGLLKTTQLTAFGAAISLFSMSFSMRLTTASNKRKMTQAISLPATALLFVVLGAVLKYGIVLPEQYGRLNITVPGTLKNLTGMLDLGFAVMMFMAARGQKGFLVLFLILWPIHMGFSLLEFSKKVVLFGIMLPAAGAFLGHQNWKRMFPWVFLALAAFVYLQNVNTAARLTILQNTGSKSFFSWNERLNLLGEALSGEADLQQLSSVERAKAQVWWLRLNYSGAQLRAMELFENEQKNPSGINLINALIPRFLWPDKPTSFAHGRYFHRIVSGNEDARTRVGITVYADGYWFGGWLGTAVYSAIMGTVLGFVTKINYRLIVQRNLIYLPVIFLGMRMAALGHLGYLQKSFIAALPIYLGYFLLIHLIISILRSQNSNTSFASSSDGHRG